LQGLSSFLVFFFPMFPRPRSSTLFPYTTLFRSSLNEFTAPLKNAVAQLDELTAWVLDRAKSNPNEIGAASVEYLQAFGYVAYGRSEEHTSELQSRENLVCRLLLEKKKNNK